MDNLTVLRRFVTKFCRKSVKIERRNWKRLSLHLASNAQKSLKWTVWTVWPQWTFCVIRKIKSSIWSIWSILSIKCWFVSRQIKQAYGFKEREYFKLKIYQLPEISSGKSSFCHKPSKRQKKHLSILRCPIFLNGTGGGTWTHTLREYQILSLARLPFRHSGLCV